jgi:Leucine-rich repeat (LRR) protein
MKGALRMASGQSDIRNEELSPIYVARHNTVNGGIDYAALNLPPEELQERLENLRMNSDAQDLKSAEDASQSLQGDMTTGTEDLAQLGTFVNVRRGGLSHEVSFQKRLLSPSSLPAIDESALLPEESMQASTPKQLPNIKKTRPSNEHSSRERQVSPAVPQTPNPSPTKSEAKPQKNSSGSPLKLFGTYDTFTNQKLLRRLSQFEEHFGDDTEQEMPSASGQESTRPELNEAFVAASSPEKLTQYSDNQHKTSRAFSSFGEGELDGFQFSESISYDSHGSSLQDEDKENISLPVLHLATQSRHKFQLEPSPALEEGVFTERQTKYTNTASITKQTISVRTMTRPVTDSSEDPSLIPASQRIENLETPRKRNGNSEGKRLPKSPLKDPTPKRRRTLQSIEFTADGAAHEEVQLDSLRETHQQMQSVIGRKRKDARHGDDQQAANPKVLAMRQILRPRTPTPSQRSSQQHERTPLHEIDLAATEQERLQREKIARIQAELDSTNPLKLSAALGQSQQMLNDSRKGSVTTQDFLDEAKKIMAGIRGKARPRSGLTSVEESESDNDRNKSTEAAVPEEFEESYEESTQEPFSRPPSREGGAPLPRLPLKQEDPELLNHLRKYQEMSDMDGIIGSSVKSIAAAKDAIESARQIERMTEETISRSSGRVVSKQQEDIIESDPPNIRITENPEMQRKRKHSGSSGRISDEEHREAEFPSNGSNASSGQSTTQSIPTGSSRGSESRRVIAPHTVSHLIPEQLAGMAFDRDRNVWIKRKTVGEPGGSHNFLPSDETEDDPFGDIPDLSVDETQELQRIKAVAAKRREDERIAQANHDDNHHKSFDGGQRPIQNSLDTTKQRLNPQNEPSSEPSKLTRFTSSGTIAETNTRATSWGDEHVPMMKQSQSSEASKNVHRSQKSTTTEVREEIVEEVEREISIHEDRVKPSTPRRRRNVTISFSSPIASVIKPPPYEDESSLDHDVPDASQSDDDAEEDFGDDSVIIHKRGSSQKNNSTKSRTVFRSTSSRHSLIGHVFSARPVSRIDEQDEESFDRNDDDRSRRSISIVVATPVPSQQTSNAVQVTQQPMHEVGTLSLTPMSDFTIHQANESFGLEVSYIARGQRYVPGMNNKRTLSHSIKELIEKITEVEPYEPFWEHMKQMELSDKRLTNLHKLSEFCEQLEELDVSRNQISQLNGAPITLRHLRITHNYLSDLTAWGHLSNLQYIDVSNNELESLSAFKSLVHLRGLRADNNRIKSLDGVGSLDGLLSLRLRGNLVESLDFAGTKLHRLTDLDLRDNRVKVVKNIHVLQCLSTLDLENNDLSNFSMDVSEQLLALKYLKLSGNNLESIDVSLFPNLRLLYLDRNRLGSVMGLLKTKHLDSLSMREQQKGAVIDPAFLDEAFEVRKLFLSGNPLHTFEPRITFLNLQYLELANCGLESLPIEFGQMLPNTRVLNLNFNALRDIKPLLGIVRLKKLHLAGNRLTRLRKTTNILAQFPTLTLFDLRSNPLTQGFYSPIIESRLVKREGVDVDEADRPEPFTLGPADREKDEKYAGCLDMDTRMLRRVYEMLILSGCVRLKTLDGLSVDSSILSANDEVWEALVNAGVVEGNPAETAAKECEEGCHDGESDVKDVAQEEVAVAPEKSSIWQGEDSFA